MPVEWDIFDSAEEPCGTCDSWDAGHVTDDSQAGDAADRVLDALVGGSSVSVGATFLPRSALSGLRRGGAQGMPHLLTALVEQAQLDFLFVPAWEPWADEAADRVAAAGAAVFWVIPGPFGVLAEREGWPETLRRSVSDAGALHGDLLAELPQLVELVRRGARLQVTAIVVAEDLAGSEGLLVAPDMAIDALFPMLKDIVGTATEEALFAVWHSDGDIRALIEAARRTGFVSVHSGGLSGGQFEKLYCRARGVGLSVLGGIAGESIRSGGPAAVSAGSAAAVLARSGGLLVCDDGGISSPKEVSDLLLALAAVRSDYSEEGAG